MFDQWVMWRPSWNYANQFFVSLKGCIWACYIHIALLFVCNNDTSINIGMQIAEIWATFLSTSHKFRYCFVKNLPSNLPTNEYDPMRGFVVIFIFFWIYTKFPTNRYWNVFCCNLFSVRSQIALTIRSIEIWVSKRAPYTYVEAACGFCPE